MHKVYWLKAVCLAGISVCLLLVSFARPDQARAQTGKPFSLPFNSAPGPATWLVGQQYGNTVGAARLGKYWYAAGQGLHFGIDFSAPCGTAIVAAADGMVEYVDNLGFGLAPHNIILSHADLSYTTLYGHLYDTPALKKGQRVQRGDVIGLSGDPDETCVSRPHMHFEVRSMNYGIAYNPVPLIDADWAMLSASGSFQAAMFAKDLTNPNQWQTLYDQPEVRFGGGTLNNYNSIWPLTQRVSPPPETRPAFNAPPISQTITARQMTQAGCCSQAWWSPDGTSLRFWDGPQGQRAITRIVSVEPETPDRTDEGLYRLFSPNGQYEIQWDASRGALAVRGLDGSVNTVPTSGGVWPRFSPGSTRLLWQYLPSESVPGSSVPRGDVSVANVDGKDRQLIISTQGISPYWLDDERVLISRRIPSTNVSELSIYNIADKSTVPLYTGTNVRGLSIAPGGKHILFMLTFQTEANTSGQYILETQQGATPRKLPFFGSVRWRDSNSLLYIPYLPGQAMALKLYNFVDDKDMTVVASGSPDFKVANDDWSVSPDGRHVAYWKADQFAIWLLRLSE